MTMIIGDVVDYMQQAIKNALMDPRTSDPSSPLAGQVWFRSDTKQLKIYDGSATKVIPFSGSIVDSDIASGAAIALSKLAVDPLARANHTGTQLASTISNFLATVVTARLDQMATPTASVAMGAQKITGLADGTASTDAASWGQVQNLLNGLAPKGAVRVATTANISLTGTQTIDGVAVAAGESVLVKNQTSAATNGIYLCAAGAWSRRADADAWSELTGAIVPVQEGSTQADHIFLCTNDQGGTIGTTSVTFVDYGLSTVVAGAALTKTGNTLDVAVDNSSIEVTADALNVKAGGITNAMLAGPVPVNKGGTGATTAAAARSNIDAVSHISFNNSSGSTTTVAVATLVGAGLTNSIVIHVSAKQNASPFNSVQVGWTYDVTNLVISHPGFTTAGDLVFLIVGS